MSKLTVIQEEFSFEKLTPRALIYIKGGKKKGTKKDKKNGKDKNGMPPPGSGGGD